MSRSHVVAAAAGLAILAMLGATTWHKPGDMAQVQANLYGAVAVVRGGETSGVRNMPSDQSARDELANAFTPIPVTPDISQDYSPLNLDTDIEPPAISSVNAAAEPNQLMLQEGLKSP